MRTRQRSSDSSESNSYPSRIFLYDLDSPCTFNISTNHAFSFVFTTGGVDARMNLLPLTRALLVCTNDECAKDEISEQNGTFIVGKEDLCVPPSDGQEISLCFSYQCCYKSYGWNANCSERR